MMKNFLISSALAVFLGLAANGVMACGGEESGKHIGSVLKVNADNSTFTIRDAETNSPITFSASKDIMKEVGQASGRVVINYEEDDEGALVAVGIAL